MKVNTLLACSILILLALGCYSVGFSADNSPVAGSVGDPVVTKSYVEKLIAEAGGKGTGSSVTLEQVKQWVADELAKQTNAGSPGGNELKIVQLQPSQALYGGAGSEIIVRSGRVIAVSSDDNGMSDVTIGKDITAGSPVELNHLLIVPREGRGIKPDAKNKQDIFVMVRGGYTIVNADGTKVTP